MIIISFDPLWHTMKQKSVSQYQLLKSGIDNKTLDGLKHNRNITLLTLEKICLILDCTPNDIVEFVSDRFCASETESKYNVTTDRELSVLSDENDFFYPE